MILAKDCIRLFFCINFTAQTLKSINYINNFFDKQNNNSSCACHMCSPHFLLRSALRQDTLSSKHQISRTGLWSNNTTMNSQNVPETCGALAHQAVDFRTWSPVLHSGTVGCHSPAAPAIPAAGLNALLRLPGNQTPQTSWGWTNLSKSSQTNQILHVQAMPLFCLTTETELPSPEPVTAKFHGREDFQSCHLPWTAGLNWGRNWSAPWDSMLSSAYPGCGTPHQLRICALHSSHSHPEPQTG